MKNSLDKRAAYWLEEEELAKYKEIKINSPLKLRELYA